MKPNAICPHPRYWRAWELDILRRFFAEVFTADIARVLGRTERQVRARACFLGLRKTRDFLAAVARERNLQPGHGSRAHRFNPGNKPGNAGTRGAETRFKAGHRPHTWVPVGSFRVTDDGLLEQKYSDDPGPPKARWRSYARIVWEREHGPIPAGHVVAFRPGHATTDPTLVTLDRLELLTRRQLLSRNSVHTIYPPELASLVQLRGVLTRAINDRAKKEPR